jgi:flavin-dependent dehydrogenase
MRKVTGKELFWHGIFAWVAPKQRTVAKVGYVCACTAYAILKVASQEKADLEVREVIEKE